MIGPYTLYFGFVAAVIVRGNINNTILTLSIVLKNNKRSTPRDITVELNVEIGTKMA